MKNRRPLRPQKEAGDGKMTGNDAEQQIRGTGSAAGRTGQAAEGSRHQEDKEHDRDIVVSDALGADMDLLIKGQVTVLDKSHDQRRPEGHHDGHHIKAHLSFRGMDVLKIDSVSQIQHQKDRDRQKSRGIGLLLRFLHFHTSLKADFP